MSAENAAIDAEVPPTCCPENPDPHEGAEPVPPFVWATILGFLAFGALYLFLNAGSAFELGGDQRTAVAPPPAVADGATVFTRACASCHQASGQGVPGVFPPLAGAEWPVASPQTPVRVVLNGLSGAIDVKGQKYAGAMPAVGAGLTDAEVAAVISYVRSSWGNAAPPVDAKTVAAVRAQHASRGPWNGGDELKAAAAGDPK